LPYPWPPYPAVVGAKGHTKPSETIRGVLDGWGIDVSDESIVWYLLDTYPERCFYLDKWPMVIGDKYDQVEIEVQWILRSGQGWEALFDLEARCRSVMTKLWLYNEVRAEALVFGNKWARRMRRTLDKAARRRLRSLPRSRAWDLGRRVEDLGSVIVEDVRHLALLVQLGARDIADTLYCLLDYQMIICPGGSGLIVYFHDIGKLDVVTAIAASDGLFVRPRTDD